MPVYEIKNEVKTYEDLRELMKKSGHEFDFDLVDRAYRVAEEAHRGQVRNSGDPYIVHPLAVACILVELGMDSECIAAGLLHDVVEDTDWTLPQITKEFGQTVAKLIDGVTKLGKIPYSSREEQQAENIRKMLISYERRHPGHHHQAGRPAAQHAHLAVHDPPETAGRGAGEHGSVRPHRPPAWASGP